MSGRIISETEALQILKNDLKKRALEKHATELNTATAERRVQIFAQIDRDVQEELGRRERSVPTVPVFH